LGYPTLEQACEEAGGFALTRPPTSREQQRIRLLEEIVRQLVPDFPELPLCVVIKSEDAVWQGMATCIPIRKPTTRFRDVRVRFDLPYVALKPRLLSGPQLGPALSTYLHELAHMFGGDRSASFSLILSEFMEVTLRHVGQIAEYEQRWAAMQERVG